MPAVVNKAINDVERKVCLTCAGKRTGGMKSKPDDVVPSGEEVLGET